MKNIGIFLRGFLMGICDTIPGISGGTVAFITGIYERLIGAINLIVNSIPEIIRATFDVIGFKKGALSNYSHLLKKLDVYFLLTLLCGIVAAILTTSRLITFLLENHFSLTLSFFIGLILASALTIFSHIKTKSIVNISFTTFGLLFGIVLTFAVPQTISPNLFYVFIGGFFAISAMFLPGISGAFILLIMGLYEYILNALHHLRENSITILVFIAGAILGAVTISKIINYLFKLNKDRTLSFLFGLVIGTLSIPVKQLLSTSVFTISATVSMLVLFSLGILAVILTNRFAAR